MQVSVSPSRTYIPTLTWRKRPSNKAACKYVGFPGDAGMKVRPT